MQPITELSIIVPTYNEAENIPKLIELLSDTLSSINSEIIIVDDNSPDKTSDIARKIARQDARVRCIQRIRRRGLSSAVIEGFLASASPYLCVMDADLQHDENLIPDMLASLKQTNDLVVASRYIENASTGTLSEHRVKISQTATRLGNMILHHKLSDPLSGFFMLKRELFEKVNHKLSGKGFKILLDIVASADSRINIGELPYHMKSREHGESKLSVFVVWEFFSLLVNKLLGKYVPLKFMLFVAVGFTGVFVHMATLYVTNQLMQWQFIYAQSLSVFVAMTSNYFLNNAFTFNDSKHTGIFVFKGLISFYITCSLGTLINVSVATTANSQGMSWWLAGIAGAAVGAVWNFALSIAYTWRTEK